MNSAGPRQLDDSVPGGRLGWGALGSLIRSEFPSALQMVSAATRRSLTDSGLCDLTRNLHKPSRRMGGGWFVAAGLEDQRNRVGTLVGDLEPSEFLLPIFMQCEVSPSFSGWEEGPEGLTKLRSSSGGVRWPDLEYEAKSTLLTLALHPCEVDKGSLSLHTSGSMLEAA